ncbi:hypothetical protein GCM10007962_08220 [Yeosuana aromativorans]|uniref:Uncharacterized protein n=2 Tax=Yeosuana aromativorans TaxID=288019 RepID=A0A8J3BK40_9FLAO|nr:hypothetical protein GCM10007962_08220 [Yeosuana aromativorans]
MVVEVVMVIHNELMQDFLLNNYSLLTHCFEAMAALTGLFLFNRYKYSTAKYFIYFLVYVIVGDFTNMYTWLVYPDKLLGFLMGTLIEKNYWWSTLFWRIGAIMFFAFYYRKVIKNQSFKKVIKYTSYGFLSFSVGYILLNWKAFFTSYFPIISILGAIIVFLCTVFYFIEILRSDEILTFYKSINFYISFAIFIWWLIITPIVFYDNYTSYEVSVYQRDWDYIKLRRFIYLSANIFMYSTFTFALIWCRPQKK